MKRTNRALTLIMWDPEVPCVFLQIETQDKIVDKEPKEVCLWPTENCAPVSLRISGSLGMKPSHHKDQEVSKKEAVYPHTVVWFLWNEHGMRHSIQGHERYGRQNAYVNKALNFS